MIVPSQTRDELHPICHLGQYPLKIPLQHKGTYGSWTNPLMGSLCERRRTQKSIAKGAKAQEPGEQNSNLGAQVEWPNRYLSQKQQVASEQVDFLIISVPCRTFLLMGRLSPTEGVAKNSQKLILAGGRDLKR
ncbi:hypothetical protein HNY73_010994 [Argiope bruennichi]|uniref:Uncharacterized protein n=1 Tax=Argiope bruennichi TaxID=94029 RepID=A0A8T0F8Y9_ARGBR|nr:hypothetical protein HNY73_010994 [Argiope bruennichi]